MIHRPELSGESRKTIKRPYGADVMSAINEAMTTNTNNESGTQDLNTLSVAKKRTTRRRQVKRNKCKRLEMTATQDVVVKGGYVPSSEPGNDAEGFDPQEADAVPTSDGLSTEENKAPNEKAKVGKRPLEMYAASNSTGLKVERTGYVPETVLRECSRNVRPISFWTYVKKQFVDFVSDSPIIRTLCCWGGDEIDMYREDEFRREEVRQWYLTHQGAGFDQTSVAAAIVSIRQETGYDLVNSHVDDKVEEMRKTVGDWAEFISQYSESESQIAAFNVWKDTVMELDACHATSTYPLPRACYPAGCKERTCVVPRHAANMALALRSKFGRMDHNEANFLLAEREYLRLSRKFHVRDVDIVAHQQITLNALFGENVLDDVALTRHRLPRWLRWAVEETQQTSRVC